MRYSVLAFPGLYGNPYDTDSWLMANLAAWWRYFFWSVVEVRIIDNSNGQHYVW